MKLDDYIESGILERYVLGQVSEKETREVQCLSSIYPEIQEELHTLQASIGGYLEEFNTPAPESLKKSIFSEIESTEQLEGNLRVEKSIQQEPQEKETDDSSSFGFWKIAASILLLATLGLLFLYSSTNSNFEEQLAEVNTENNILASTIEEKENVIETQDEIIELASNPIYSKHVLNTTDENQEQSAVVFWNNSTKEVIVLSDRLPDLESNKQYQLWALQGDTPVSLGVIPKDDSGAIDMEAIDKADAFAITIEPEGGSANPTLEQLQVMGKTKS